MKKTLSIFIFLLLPHLALAAEKTSPPSFSIMSVLNMLFGLAVVVALIYGLSWVLKKYGRFPASSQLDIKVLGGVSVGTRERAVVVQVEGKRLLLGVAPGRVQMLHVLDDKPFEKSLATAMERQS
jgi:flagellar protein FliO/FliZ